MNGDRAIRVIKRGQRRGLSASAEPPVENSKLIEVASRSPEVRRITARTLPEPNASARVLEKVGMAFAGEVMDPEDGRVWEWQLARRAERNK